MEPGLSGTNIKIGANAVFEEILPLTRVRNILSIKRIAVHTNAVISNIQMQIICDIPVLLRKLNSHAK